MREQNRRAILKLLLPALHVKRMCISTIHMLVNRQCRRHVTGVGVPPACPSCREGWHALAAATLPKLAACQLATGSAGLAHTAAALLSLPAPFRGTPVERQAACELLLQASQLPQSLGSSLPLLPSSPTSAEASLGGINVSAILVAAPLPASVSRFFGRTDPEGAPVLSPPLRAAAGAGASAGGSGSSGALSAAVGDALAVKLVVRNQLPVALPLREVVLTLGVLQEMTGGRMARWFSCGHGNGICFALVCPVFVLWSSAHLVHLRPLFLCACLAAVPVRNLPGLPWLLTACCPSAGLASHLPRPLCPLLLAVIHSPRASARPLSSLRGVMSPSPGSQRRSSTPASPLGDTGGVHSSSLISEDSLGGRERFEVLWQQVEELPCALVAVNSGQTTAGAEAGSGGGAPSLQPLQGQVMLPPGSSTLTFLAAPVQRGLYKALHLRARLQQLPLHAAVQPPSPLWEQQQGAAASAGAGPYNRRGSMSPQALRRSSRAGVPSGSPLTPVAGGAPLTPPAQRPAGDAPAGARAAEAIVLSVEQAQPRVQLALVAAGGSLVAGQEQWLGLALAPERDSLHGARLELTWPLAHAAGALTGGGIPG